MAVVGVGVAPVGVGCGGATPPKERDSDVPFGGSGGTPGDRHWSGIQGGVSRDSAPARECRPGGWWMASVSAAKVPQSRRAGAHRAAGGFAADLPRRAGAGRRMRRGGGRAYRRQKSVPDQAPRWRLTSEPGYHPPGSVTAPRLRSRGTSFAVRVVLPYPIPPTGLGGVRSTKRRPASHPPTRKTSDLPPGIGISIGPPILTSTKQQNNKTTQRIREA